MDFAARLLGLALVTAGLVRLPAFYAVGIGQVSLWAPDIAALVYERLALALALALLRVALYVRLPRGVKRQ